MSANWMSKPARKRRSVKPNKRTDKRQRRDATARKRAQREDYDV